jgi:hypothetical protein
MRCSNMAWLWLWLWWTGGGGGVVCGATMTRNKQVAKKQQINANYNVLTFYLLVKNPLT